MPSSQNEFVFPERLAVVVITLGVAALFVGMIRGFLIALFLAAVFSAMAYPLFRWINYAIVGRRGMASALTLFLLVSAAILPGIGLLILVSEQAQSVAKDALPWVQSQLENSAAPGLQLPDWMPFRDQLQAWLPSIATKLSELTSKIGEFAAQAVSAIATGAAQFLLNLFVMLYAMFYFLHEGPTLLEGLKRYALSLGSVQKRVFDRAVVVSRATVKGTLIIGLVQGLLGGIGFWMFGVEGAAFWGAVMAIASMLPVVGTALIWIPAVIYLLAVGESTSALGLAAWSAIIVSNIDNVLRPILVGGDTEMPDLLVLIATFGGLSVFGGSGLILGPVIAAVFMTLVEITYEALQPQSREEAEEVPLHLPEQDASPAAIAPAETATGPTAASRQGLLDVALSEDQKRELEQLAEEMAKVRAARPPSS